VHDKNLLIEKFAQLKIEEDIARNKRLHCEVQILKAFFGEDHLEAVSKEPLLFEANRSIDAFANDKEYKVKVKYSINRKIDQDELKKIYADIPTEIRERLIRLKPELNLTEYKYLLRNEPAIYNLVSNAVIETAAKPYLTIEEK
jgi:hypothetical protein